MLLYALANTNLGLRKIKYGDKAKPIPKILLKKMYVYKEIVLF